MATHTPGIHLFEIRSPENWTALDIFGVGREIQTSFIVHRHSELSIVHVERRTQRGQRTEKRRRRRRAGRWR